MKTFEKIAAEINSVDDLITRFGPLSTIRRCSRSQVCRNVLNLLKSENSQIYADICNITNTTDFDFNTAYILGDLKTCAHCGKKFYSPLKSRKFCSLECSANDKDRQERAMQTVKEKYGYDNPYQVPEFKEKIRQNSLEKYGVPCPLQALEIKEKTKQTLLKKYGVDNIYKSQEIQTKIRKTTFERYGRETYYGSPVHIERVHDRTVKKNRADYNEVFIKEHFVKNGLLLTKEMNDYFGIKCAKEWKYKFGLPSVSSQGQYELFQWIPTENKKQNDRFLIKPLEIDILIPDAKLGIEYNGSYWHSYPNKPRNYHLEKTELVQKTGYQLFQVFDFDDIEIWKSMISNKLGQNKKIYARNCNIRELQHFEVSEFLEENHLQGDCKSKINLGLFYENELVQVMTFSKPRYNKKYEYELIRLCTKKFYSVIGGSSKLFKYFIRTYNPKSIISYANRRFSQGKIYEVLGFKFSHVTSPNYFYTNSEIILSRVQCQKHKLSKLLDNFDPRLTEVQNMNNAGFFQVFDCGNLVYVWNQSDL